MSLRLLIALIVVLMLAAVGCARRQEAPETVPAVAPLPDTSEAAQPAETEATAADAEGQKLYETKCAQCHTLDRVEKHDPAEEPWPELVEDMQGKKPGWISDEEAAAIVEHLEKTHGTP